MAKRKRPFLNHAEWRRIFVLEKRCIEKEFPFLRCTLLNKKLTCSGRITPSEGCDTYQIRIDYFKGGTPLVYIVDPPIEPTPEYHIYESGHLCLYDPRVSPWSTRMLLHQTIIPWTAEWLVFYELWRDTGEWKGPEAPHGDDEPGK